MTALLPRCPECGASRRPATVRCWLCGAKLPEIKSLEAGVRPTSAATQGEIVEATLVDRETNATFGLSSLFLVATLLAVGAGVFTAAPGIGFLFAVIALPALVRTIVVSHKERGDVTSRGKLVIFLQSAGVMVLVLMCIAMALFVALFIACTGGLAVAIVPGLGDEKTVWWTAVAGGLFALTGMGVVLWAIWNNARKRR